MEINDPPALFQYNRYFLKSTKITVTFEIITTLCRKYFITLLQEITLWISDGHPASSPRLMIDVAQERTRRPCEEEI
jgi:hypothetical protein